MTTKNKILAWTWELPQTLCAVLLVYVVDGDRSYNEWGVGGAAALHGKRGAHVAGGGRREALGAGGGSWRENGGERTGGRAMLTFNVKKRWYDKIRSGEKAVEYRDVKPYWSVRLMNAAMRHIPMSDKMFQFLHHLIGIEKNELPSLFVINARRGIVCDIPCVVRLGYTKEMLRRRIKSIRIVDGADTDLKIDAPVYAIEFNEEAMEDAQQSERLHGRRHEPIF